MKTQKTLEKILEIYGKLYYPHTGMKVKDIQFLNDRIYIIHDETDKILSLLPPIENEKRLGK